MNDQDLRDLIEVAFSRGMEFVDWASFEGRTVSEEDYAEWLNDLYLELREEDK